MDNQQIGVVEACAARSAAGEIQFGEVVATLTAGGIERYHADYTRMETTYYAVDGGSHVVPMRGEHTPIAVAFSARAIERAVLQSQRGEIRYPEFTRLALGAGCVGYFVQITGKCVQYFGRNGEVHTEWFPGAKPS